MSFSGIFRSKNRKNRVIHDPKPVSPKDEATCNCMENMPVEQAESTLECQTPEPCVAAVDCGEQCQSSEADCCEEVCLEETGTLEVFLEAADQGEVCNEEVCIEEEHSEQVGC